MQRSDTVLVCVCVCVWCAWCACAVLVMTFLLSPKSPFLQFSSPPAPPCPSPIIFCPSLRVPYSPKAMGQTHAVSKQYDHVRRASAAHARKTYIRGLAKALHDDHGDDGGRASNGGAGGDNKGNNGGNGGNGAGGEAGKERRDVSIPENATYVRQAARMAKVVGKGNNRNSSSSSSSSNGNNRDGRRSTYSQPSSSHVLSSQESANKHDESRQASTASASSSSSSFAPSSTAESSASTLVRTSRISFPVQTNANVAPPPCTSPYVPPSSKAGRKKRRQSAAESFCVDVEHSQHAVDSYLHGNRDQHLASLGVRHAGQEETSKSWLVDFDQQRGCGGKGRDGGDQGGDDDDDDEGESIDGFNADGDEGGGPPLDGGTGGERAAKPKRPRRLRMNKRIQSTGGHTRKDNHADNLVHDACLLIACHESCYTEDAERAFKATLRSALVLFPPQAIFVCDNGRDLKPCDETELVTLAVSREYYHRERINYVYVPEGNKTHAIYWVTEHWIPSLVKAGHVPSFRYAVITDDDVPLPNNLHIPSSTVRKQNHVKAVCFCIRATTEDGSQSQVRTNDIISQFSVATHTVFTLKYTIIHTEN